MSAREVVVLGTASQVPTRTRAHNAVFLAWDALGILFDPGEGTQRQMTLAGLAASRITHIALTHFHGDHCLGLASIIQRLSLDGVEHPVEVFYPESGEAYFQRLRHASVFHDRARVVPRPLPVVDGPRPAADLGQGTVLLADRLEHVIDCLGYRVQEPDLRTMLPDRLAALGLHGPAIGRLAAAGRIEVEGRTIDLSEVSVPRPGQSFALVMDTRPCAGAERLERGADLVVSEATFLSGEATEATGYGHMTAAQAAGLAPAAGVRRLVLTHFSQRYTDLGPFRREAAEHHPEVVVAEDLARVAAPRRR